MRVHTGILSALGSAALFGASVPIAKLLVGEMSPVLLAGLLYAGSGVGLCIALLLRRWAPGSLRTIDWPRGYDIAWFAGAVLFGGVLGPVLLMLGLTTTSASASALLLNLEAAFTALLAWFVFRENFDRRIAFGMALIVAGGVLLSWTPTGAGLSSGALLIAGACLCWGIDNNLTRKVSAGDAMLIACIKGVAAGVVNIAIALSLGAKLPSWSITAAAAGVGFVGYGISLALFVRALRDLGSARSSAYFSIAPFFGTALALLLQHEAPTLALGAAAALMAVGVWLHLSEKHTHEHQHGHLAHEHSHVHDAHHRHGHGARWDGVEPHTHAHVHPAMRHAHPHYPDIHHRHEH